MKARFNYDLSEVASILAIQRALGRTQGDLCAETKQRDHFERQELIDRADRLTQLMAEQSGKAREVHSRLHWGRALALLKPQ
jgi:hypothetical protein